MKIHDNIENARARARSVYATMTVITGLWALAELFVNKNFAAFFGLLAASLLAWLVRFLLSADGVQQMLAVFNQPSKDRS